MRYVQALRRRYDVVGHYTGLVLMIAAGIVLAPLLALPFYPHEAGVAPDFLLPAAGLVAVGLFLHRRHTPAAGETLTMQEGAVVVVLSWIGSIAASSAVFMAAHGLPFTLAVFEATSGLTTTGLSVVDVSQASHLVLLFRSILEGAGGAGLAIIMLSALAGPAGLGLSIAEGRGDPLVPHVRRSARIVLALYLVYTVAGVVALAAAGMDWFDAVNHAIAAVSTGGFSTRPESIGYYRSARVEAVTMVLMLLGTTNFLSAWALLRGRVGAFLKNGELRLQAALVPLAALAVFSGVSGALYVDAPQAARIAVFEVVSALSTTGFSTVSYGPWPPFPVWVLVLLMLVGGGTGSTAGGIKQYRVYVLLRSVGWEVRRRLDPPTVVPAHTVWVGEHRRPVPDGDVREIAVFVFLYLCTLALVAGILMAHGHDVQASLFESASALGTVGLSVGVTAPSAAPGVLWTLTGGMLLGRLEFFALAVGIIRLARDGAVALGHGRRSRP